MKNITSSPPHLTQLKYVLLFCVFCIVTFRSSLHFLIYDIAINTHYFKISMAIVFILLFTALMVHRIHFNQIDYIFIFLGALFVFYNIIVFDFRGVVNSFFYFIGVFLFYPHLKFYKIFHKFFVYTSLYVAIELLLEFLVFNGKHLGLDINFFIPYEEFVRRSNPFNFTAGDLIGPYIRLDGVFGSHQLTGSYLAVSTAYFFGYIRENKYIYIFIINALALVLTLSTVSILACFSSILILSIINFRKKNIYLMSFLIFITYNTKYVQMLINRFITNSSNEVYINSFLFDNKGNLYQFIFGFNNRKSFENDIIELLFYFGIIPTIFLMLRFIYPIIKSRKVLFRDPIFTSCSLAVFAGVITLIHQGGVVGWHIGLHFLFMSSILINYSKKVCISSIK
jgi:hypothetical protein